jgi:acyl carrier protein
VIGANPRDPGHWGSNSLDRIEIVMACEEAFGGEISDEDMQKLYRYFRTKEELFDYLRRRRKGDRLN